MSHSTKAPKPEKPRPDFPLFPHGSGQWAKKIRRKLHYFGSWREDPTGETALDIFEREWPYLKRGETPPPIDTRDGCTIRQLCNHFLETKEELMSSGELSPRTFRDYYNSCAMLIDQFGRDRTVESLRPDDFRAFRAKLAKKYNVTTLKAKINITSVVFNHAEKNKLIDSPVDYGDSFKRPSAKMQRRHRNQSGPRLYERHEVERLIEAAGVQLRAMVYLGLNCGFGNTDVGSLPKSAVNLETGWIEYPRPKTEIPRRIPLWPETIAALRESFENRPKPKQRKDRNLCFLTASGLPWVRVKEREGGKPATPIDTVGQRFGELLRKLKINGERRLGFYTFRHCFETIGGESKDQTAVDAIMGHVDNTMGGNYRHRISDERLRAVVNVVRDWLFADDQLDGGQA